MNHRQHVEPTFLQQLEDFSSGSVVANAANSDIAAVATAGDAYAANPNIAVTAGDAYATNSDTTKA